MKWSQTEKELRATAGRFARADSADETSTESQRLAGQRDPAEARAYDRIARTPRSTAREDGTLGPDPRRGRYGSGQIIEAKPIGCYLPGTRWPSGRRTLAELDTEQAAYVEIACKASHSRTSALRELQDLSDDMQASLRRGEPEKARAILRHIFAGCDPIDIILCRAKPDGDSPELDPIRKEVVGALFAGIVEDLRHDPYCFETKTERRARLVRETSHLTLGDAERITEIPRRTLSRLRAQQA